MSCAASQYWHKTPCIQEYKLDSIQNQSTTRFSTHTSSFAQKLHALSEAILIPGRFSLQMGARILEPLPGKDKNSKLIGLVIRISAAVALLILLPFAIISSPFGLILRCIDHQFRPFCSIMGPNGSRSSYNTISLTENRPLHVRTHNLGLVPSSMSILGDLRCPKIRAQEIVQSIVGDLYQPDILCFQEVFHEDATSILVHGIHSEYPYIIHTIAPNITGFSNGTVIASKYPIEQINFQLLDHMIGPEKVTPRGVIKITISSEKGPIAIYSAHIQALTGKERAEARLQQIKEIQSFIAKDKEELPSLTQILVGDFNTSRVTAWGEDHLEPEGQPEAAVFQYLQEEFNDLYLNDHDPLTGARVVGTHSRYLDFDNRRSGVDLEEPTGSWHLGPCHSKDASIVASRLFKSMASNRKKHSSPTPKRIQQISIPKSNWGTDTWHSHQVANTARIDYILTPKLSDPHFESAVEIRRTYLPKETHSASSDHLPVDGIFWYSTP